jgi:hypothetical protein
MLPMSLIFSFAFFSSNCFIPNSDFYEICFYHGIRVVTAWQGVDEMFEENQEVESSSSSTSSQVLFPIVISMRSVFIMVSE